MKHTKKVEENNEYVTKGFLKEAFGGAIVEIVTAVTDRLDGRIDRVESTLHTRIDSLEKDMLTKFDILESNMVTKKDLIQIHDNFVSRGEFNGLNARVGILEETVYE
jgi:hypothetical protein